MYHRESMQDHKIKNQALKLKKKKMKIRIKVTYVPVTYSCYADVFCRR